MLVIQEAHVSQGDWVGLFSSADVYPNMHIDPRRGGLLTVINHSWLRGCGVYVRDRIPGRLSSFEIPIGEQHIAVFNLHMESEDYSYRSLPMMMWILGDHFKHALGVKIVAGDFDFEPAMVAAEQSHGHKRLEAMLRSEIGELTLLVPPSPSFIGTSVALPRSLDLFGVSLPFSSIGSLGLHACCLHEKAILEPPKLSDHIPVKLWASPRHRDAEAPLAASLVNDAAWVALAKQMLRSKLERAQDNRERVAAVQRACREATVSRSFGDRVGRDDLELNIYYARCALKLVLRGDIDRAQSYCSAAPHWDIDPFSAQALFELDLVIRQYAFKLSQVRDKENEARSGSAVSQLRSAQMRSRDSGLFAAWRAQTKVSALPALRDEETLVTSG